ncbi:hypothetical protein HHK36_027425 [Tetracentron sinense]|uniref:Uncharacterized protein n=1 Tax=Tetracentron sinense TaxID=13715 RepID=A0A834YHV2_TETSI|nr:hypothetical protein HHK36_027425 [Tetracentron sinense]
MQFTATQFLQSLSPTISAIKTMETLINPSSISSPTPKNLFTASFCISSRTSIKIFNRASISRSLLVKCSSEQRENGGLKDVLSGMVDKRVEELLNREENRELLDGLGKATQRVEMAKKELADIERREIEAAQLRDYVNQLESRTSEIAECQREILEARAMVDEAERSLSLNMDGVGTADALIEKENEEIDKDEERWESIKAASISAIVGTLAGLPISFAQVTSSSQLILPLAITFISCALFGVTFRYTIRRDLDNIHLKTGASAAFGVVKGLAALGAGPPLELDAGSFLSHAIDGAIYVSGNLFIFVFAAVGLDFCFKMRLLSPFPIKRSVSRTNAR